MQEPNAYDESKIAALLQRAGQTWQTRLLPALDEALRALPEQDEMIVHLSFYQEAADSEIAALLEIPGGAEAVPALRQTVVAQLADAAWARGLTTEHVEVLLRTAGEAWRLTVAEPLPDAERTAATRAMAQVAQAGGARSPDSNPAGSVRDRPSLRRLRLIKPIPAPRFAVAASVVLLGLYGALWLIGRATLSETYPLASVEAYEETLRAAVRGGEGATDAQRAFTQGAAALLEAPKSTLGLFPRYDQEQTAHAIGRLEQTFGAANDPFLRARAAFFLAKAHLMRGDTTAARLWLHRVLDQEVAAYRDGAQALLRSLEMP